MALGSAPLPIVLDVGSNGWAQSLIHQQVHERDYRWNAIDSWETLISPSEVWDKLPFEAELLHGESYQGERRGVFVAQSEDTVFQIQGGSQDMSVSAWATDRATAQRFVDTVKVLAPEIEDTAVDDGRAWFNFWWLSPNGPNSRMRRLVVPKWSDIKQNYSTSTREQLEQLFEDFTPSSAGKLILWSGVPGTGKTFALRALTDAWRTWCKVHYIIDTDKFFMDQAAYMTSLLMNEEGVGMEDDSITSIVRRIHAPSSTVDPDEPDNPWRLFVFEDAGELLTADAKSHVGQALSRFLNVCDGLIGQGLRVLILITTNEDLGALHPAVTRSGRCLARVQFEEFTRVEAQEWLHLQNRSDIPVGSQSTLADLYAQLEDRTTESPRRPVGFRV